MVGLEISSVYSTYFCANSITDQGACTSDFLEIQSKVENGTRVVPIAPLWSALVDGLNPIWPSRFSLGGISLGDVWPCPTLGASFPNPAEGDDFVPFHKLTMWLTYSLVEVLQKNLKWCIDGLEDMTGLPEYRNGAVIAQICLMLILIY